MKSKILTLALGCMLGLTNLWAAQSKIRLSDLAFTPVVDTTTVQSGVGFYVTSGTVAQQLRALGSLCLGAACVTSWDQVGSPLAVVRSEPGVIGYFSVFDSSYSVKNSIYSESIFTSKFSNIAVATTTISGDLTNLTYDVANVIVSTGNLQDQLNSVIQSTGYIANNYLTLSSAAATYPTINYSDATYLKKVEAAQMYLSTITAAANYLQLAGSQTVTGAPTFGTITVTKPAVLNSVYATTATFMDPDSADPLPTVSITKAYSGSRSVPLLTNDGSGSTMGLAFKNLGETFTRPTIYSEVGRGLDLTVSDTNVALHIQSNMYSTFGSSISVSALQAGTSIVESTYTYAQMTNTQRELVAVSSYNYVNINPNDSSKGMLQIVNNLAPTLRLTKTGNFFNGGQILFGGTDGVITNTIHSIMSYGEYNESYPGELIINSQNLHNGRIRLSVVDYGTGGYFPPDVYIDSNHRVSIGTTSSTETFTVNGTVAINSTTTIQGPLIVNSTSTFTGPLTVVSTATVTALAVTSGAYATTLLANTTYNNIVTLPNNPPVSGYRVTTDDNGNWSYQPPAAVSALALYLSTQTADVSGYDLMFTSAPYVNLSVSTITLTTSDSIISSYISPIGIPGILSLPAGTWFNASYFAVSSTNGKIPIGYPVYRQYNPDGSTVFISSGAKAQINTLTPFLYYFPAAVPSILFQSTSTRVVVEWHGYLSGTGVDPKLYVYKQNGYPSQLTLPSPSVTPLSYCTLNGCTMTGQFNAPSANISGQSTLSNTTVNGTLSVSSTTALEINGITTLGGNSNSLIYPLIVKNNSTGGSADVAIQFATGGGAPYIRAHRDQAAAAFGGISIHASGGTEVARFTRGGNVGIGTTSPSEKLVVDGNIKANYGLIVGGSTTTIRGQQYTWPSAHAIGTLTNDGAGNLSWTSASVPLTTATVAATPMVWTDSQTYSQGKVNVTDTTTYPVFMPEVLIKEDIATSSKTWTVNLSTGTYELTLRGYCQGNEQLAYRWDSDPDSHYDISGWLDDASAPLLGENWNDGVLCFCDTLSFSCRSTINIGYVPDNTVHILTQFIYRNGSNGGTLQSQWRGVWNPTTLTIYDQAGGSNKIYAHITLRKVMD